jgi:hypothetical protein
MNTRYSVLAVMAMFVILLGGEQQQVNANSIMNKFQETANAAAKVIQNSCIIHDNCNKEFFKLDNYCCLAQCCNMFDYIFSRG